MAVAERKLLASFMVCAMPALWPMTKTLPNTESASLTMSMSACGPDTMTASVPLTAPATPPDTGLSICAMSRLASPVAMVAAMREPVVERSTKRLMRLPCRRPPSPTATLATICGSGRLAITVSTRSATSCGDEASFAPRATNGATASLRVS